MLFVAQMRLVLQRESGRPHQKKKSFHLFGRKKAKAVEPQPPIMPPAGTTISLNLIFLVPAALYDFYKFVFYQEFE